MGTNTRFAFQSNFQPSYGYATCTTTYSVPNGINVVLASSAGGAYTVTPFSATGKTGVFMYIVKSTADFSVITINSGAYNTTINTIGESVLLVSDGSTWQLANRYVPSVWTSFTPTGSWSTNTTFTGFWKRVGDSLQVRTYLTLAGAPTAATLTINVPSGVTIDTAKLTSTDGSDGYIGSGVLTSTGVAKYIGALVYSSSSAVSTRYVDNSNPDKILVINATTPVTWKNTDFLSFVYEVPITGWNG